MSESTANRERNCSTEKDMAALTKGAKRIASPSSKKSTVAPVSSTEIPYVHVWSCVCAGCVPARLQVICLRKPNSSLNELYLK